MIHRYEIITIVSISLVYLLLAGCFTQPDIPKINPKEINIGVAKLCLKDISKKYQSKYLTYKGHFDAWYFRWKSTHGYELDKNDRNYLIDYNFFEEAVNCHILSSGDDGLNMTLSSIEFKSIFNVVAKNYGITERLN